MRRFLTTFWLAATGLALLASCIPSVNELTTTTGEPIVCITFDDGHPTVYSVAFPCMRSIDTTYRATHFFPMIFLDTTPAGIGMTLAKLKIMEAAGWQTAGHTWHHVDLSSVSLESAAVEIKSCYDYLVQNGLHHESFAYPKGNYTTAVESLAGIWFPNLRTAHDYLYTDGVNRKDLGYFAVKGTHTTADLIARVERARLLGAPLVIMGFHAVLTDTEPPITYSYYTRRSIFLGFLRYLKQQQLPVMTIDSAMAILGAN
ncbi:MAG: polysaccharide deacetylase family protein [Chitinispirillaceae bacterium]|jgi:peptidoglycan/xylan/chitin deacetylase (PgdA/CDA1 family)